MANTTFPERLAYLVWLQHLRTGECPSNTDIANGVGLTQGAISQWWGKRHAPRDRDTFKALLAYFDVPGHEDWVAEGQGDAPRPALWQEWVGARHPVSVVKAPGIDHTGKPTAVKRPKRA